MITTAKNLSPFDVNMAMDAGWVSAMPYINVEPSEVRGLVQDAIFSRSVKGLQKTGIFIGGRDSCGESRRLKRSFLLRCNLWKCTVFLLHVSVMARSMRLYFPEAEQSELVMISIQTSSSVLLQRWSPDADLAADGTYICLDATHRYAAELRRIGNDDQGEIIGHKL